MGCHWDNLCLLLLWIYAQNNSTYGDSTANNGSCLLTSCRRFQRAATQKQGIRVQVQKYGSSILSSCHGI